MSQLISIAEFCNHYAITQDFIEMLEDNGIIALQSRGIQKFIEAEQLADLERYRILHYELHINVEGIDAIRNLLEKQAELLREINELRSSLRLYE